MKAVILAGGVGSRISEESIIKPKPMIEIGGKPILWHIMKIYSHYGINEFIICLGYKGYIIKEYFSNYFLHSSDVTLDLSCNKMEVHNNESEPWKVTLVDTGATTMTGGRLKRVQQFVGDEMFCLTYGDGLSDVNIKELISIHNKRSSLVTVTAVKPPGRFGSLVLEGEMVSGFKEKPEGDGGWINGGFFVCSPKVFDYIESDAILWEQEPLERLAQEGNLSAYFHQGYWQPMDTLRDKNTLETRWADENPPWKVWK